MSLTSHVGVLANMGWPIPLVAGQLFTWVWFAYVAVTLVWEALALGWWFRVRAPVAVKASLCANVISAFAGICPCWFVIPGAWAIYPIAVNVNPDPFGTLVLLLIATGILSALIEATVWRHFLRRAKTPAPTMPLIGKVLSVHLVGVPLALCVLLVPARPYQYVEGRVNEARATALRLEIWGYVANNRALPTGKTWSEFASELHGSGQDARVYGYRAEYHRFDRGEMRRHPLEFNPSCAGLTQDSLVRSTVWIVRWRGNAGWQGLVFTGGWPRLSTDSTALGVRPSKP